jgi:hypothetical protein
MLKAKFIPKVQKKIRSFQSTNQNMSNIPKSIEYEFQDFIELLFPSVLWLRTQVEEDKIDMMSIFTSRVPLFRHKTQELCFCYLPNIKSKWNKFK